jgi:hypothetical protein
VPPGRPQFVDWVSLHEQFGQGFARVRDFRRRFLQTLREVLLVYPSARIDSDGRGVSLFHSPPPVSARSDKHLVL